MKKEITIRLKDKTSIIGDLSSMSCSYPKYVVEAQQNVAPFPGK